MILRIPSVVLASLVVAVCAGCGFHLRQEATLPASMQRMHIEIADPLGALGRDLAKALPRSGVVVVDEVEPGVAVLNITANRFHTDVLSVSGRARANEYTIRYHVEFNVNDAAGALLVPAQVIELTRDFTFDASQALGISAETDLLTAELERDMVQTLLRRLEAVGKARSQAPGL
jgi:LPS-assembly lipoprotein